MTEKELLITERIKLAKIDIYVLSPQEMMLRPEFLDFCSKHKIERFYKEDKGKV